MDLFEWYAAMLRQIMNEDTQLVLASKGFSSLGILLAVFINENQSPLVEDA